MNFFSDSTGITAKKIVVIPAIYNNDRQLEFLIQPEKHLLYPNEILLHFNVKIPAEYVLDNQNADKLFDSLEVQINNTKITNRSSTNEYFLSSYFYVKSSFPADVVESSMRPMGWTTTNSYHLSTLNGFSNAIKNAALRDMCDYEVVEDGVKTFRLYNIITPIISPLFLQTKPLPPNITLNINFRRSNVEIPLIQLTTDSKNTYATSNIEILNPHLECTYIENEKHANKYNFLTTKELKYTLDEPLIRTFTIDKGLNTATFNVNTGGRLPYMLFSTLIKPDAFFGDKELSPTRFQRSGLTGFQVMVDNFTLPGSHVTMSEENIVEPYVAFLRNTKIYNNALAGKSLHTSDFSFANFILSYDLSTSESESGWLSVKYDFENYLEENTIAIVYLIYEKQLVINKQGEVSINN